MGEVSRVGYGGGGGRGRTTQRSVTAARRQEWSSLMTRASKLHSFKKQQSEMKNEHEKGHLIKLEAQ